MSRQPLVSIVMPAYNAERTIGAAVSSALWQTVPDVEVVVVDDGSSDATAAIASAQAGSVLVLKQPNRGVAAARNAGVEAARGRFVAFCDADDLLFEQHVEAMLDVWHREASGGMVTANAYWLLPRGISPRKLRHRGRFPEYREQRMALLQSNFVSTMSLLPRSLFEQLGGFDPSLRQGEDWELWLRVAFAGHRIAHQPEPLALYRWSVAGLSSETESFHATEYDILRRVQSWPQLTAAERMFVELRLGSPVPRALLTRGDNELRAGRFAAAAATYRQLSALVPAENLLVRKARLLGLAPYVVGPLLRRRLLASDRRLGMDERHER